MPDLTQKLSNTMSSKKSMFIITLVGIYLLSTGISLAAFTLFGKGGSSFIDLGDLEKNRAAIKADTPRTEECPLNGGKFTKIEKGIWEDRRPIAAMIENHADSRPISGISNADVVYEAVAEGGITRFLGIFYCGAAASDVKIAPVRSARIYYIDYAAEYGDKPIFMHVGGANDFSGSGDTTKEVRALETLETMGWRVPRGNDFDTIYDSGFPVFWRNYERLGRTVATEHTMMSSLDAAYQEAEKRGFGDKNEGVSWDKKFTPWKFSDEKPKSAKYSSISFSFWDNKSDYDVSWKYDAGNNQYLRSNGGDEFTDHETKQQVSAKNVVILFAKERGPVDRNGHMFYTTIGEGDVLVFANGEVIEGTWEKDKRQDRTIFKNEDGDEIAFVRGPIWIEIVPDGNDIDY